MTQNQDIKESTMVAENIEESAQYNEYDNSKKKFPLQKPIIIALCIFVFTIALYFVLSFTIKDIDKDDLMLENSGAHSIEGTWLHETSDGYKMYYTIRKSAEDYSLDLSLDAMGWPGKCVVVDGEDKSTVEISLDLNSPVTATSLYGTYTYKVSNESSIYDRKLTLTDSYDNEVVLKRVKKPQMTDYVQPHSDFKTDDRIIGTWQVDLGVGQMVEASFGKDGVLVMKYDNGASYEKYYYSLEDTVVLRKTFIIEPYEDQLDYQITENGLVFGGVLWTKIEDKSTISNK